MNVRRDVRSVPNLIYAIEQLEKFLIKLDKKAKVTGTIVNCIYKRDWKLLKMCGPYVHVHTPFLDISVIDNNLVKN